MSESIPNERTRLLSKPHPWYSGPYEPTLEELIEYYQKKLEFLQLSFFHHCSTESGEQAYLAGRIVEFL